jgi:hypothetical protein
MMPRALVLATCLGIAAAAFAADQTLLGRQLLVKNPSTPDKRSVVVMGKETASPNTLVGDPATAGGQLSVVAHGASPGTPQHFALPGGVSPLTGKPFWTGDAAKGFRYKDAKGENGPVKALQIKKSASGSFQLKASLSGKGGAISVVPPNPGTAGCAVLQLGGGDAYNVRFVDGAVTNNADKLFKVTAPASEGICTTTTTTTSTTSTTSTTVAPVCGNGVLEAGEHCDGGPYCTGACIEAPPNCCVPAEGACRNAPPFILNANLFFFCSPDAPMAGGVCGEDGVCAVQPIPTTPVCCQTGTT